MQKPLRDGQQWQEGDILYTVNSAIDKTLPPDQGQYYVSMKNVRTGEHSTAVYNSDGTFAPVKANRDWKAVRKQSQGIAAMIVDSFRRAIRIVFK